MRKIASAIAAVTMLTSAIAQETSPGTGRRPASRRGEAAGYSSRDATVLSMMGWGLGLAVGMAALCALLDHNTSGDGSNVHSTTH